MEPWVELLRTGRGDAMWDGFIDRYRPLIFSAIRHYLRDPDDVMDVFAQACAALREDDFARLRQYADGAPHRGRFSTWLVAVVRNLTVDWLRHRDGRISARVPSQLSPVQQRIYRRIFLERRSHRECFHLLAAADGFPLSEHEFATELAATYRLVPAIPRLRKPARDWREIVPDDLPAPDHPQESPDAAARLAALLGTLSAEDRLAVQLFVVDELSAADVARIVGWPSAKTVYNRVTRALAAMRMQLTAAGLTPEDL